MSPKDREFTSFSVHFRDLPGLSARIERERHALPLKVAADRDLSQLAVSAERRGSRD